MRRFETTTNLVCRPVLVRQLPRSLRLGLYCRLCRRGQEDQEDPEVQVVREDLNKRFVYAFTCCLSHTWWTRRRAVDDLARRSRLAFLTGRSVHTLLTAHALRANRSVHSVGTGTTSFALLSWHAFRSGWAFKMAFLMNVGRTHTGRARWAGRTLLTWWLRWSRWQQHAICAGWSRVARSTGRSWTTITTRWSGLAWRTFLARAACKLLL